MAELLDPALVAIAEELGCEEGGDAGLGHLDADETGAERDDVRVVVLARKAGRERLGDDAQRACGLRFTAIEMPMPEPHNATPRSALPSSIALARR